MFAASGRRENGVSFAVTREAGPEYVSLVRLAADGSWRRINICIFWEAAGHHWVPYARWGDVVVCVEM